MAKNIPESQDDSQQVTLSIDDLKQLLKTNNNGASEGVLLAALQSIAEGQRSLSAALVESRKPYVDPKAIENAEAARQQTRVQIEREKATIAQARKICGHKLGSNSLSDSPGTDSSFCLHRLDTGEVIGICSNCQKEISSLRDEDAPYFANVKKNRFSSAGVRSFSNPLEVQLGRFSPDEREAIRAQRS